MTLGVYIHADSFIHRTSPGPKLLALLALGTLIILVGDAAALAALLALVLALYRAARLPWRAPWTQLRPAIAILALLFAVQWAFVGAMDGLVVVLRFATLILFASLVSLTTKASDLIDTVIRAARPLAHFGISPTKIGLTFSLALRFIPVIAGQLDEVREAQRARGLERSVVAVAVPLIVRTLKTATEIGDAIEARSFDPDDAGRFRLADPFKRLFSRKHNGDDHEHP